MGLVDSHGRKHDDLRVSVTDRCNLRCAYCIPAEPVWFDRSEILRFEEMCRLASLLVREGVRKIRVTGGEPLLRRGVVDLVAMLARIPGVEDLSLTTNAVLLDRLAGPLARAGLRRVNVSLDTIDRARFRALTGRDALDRVLAGLAAAAEAGLDPVKLNTVLLRGTNDDEIEAIVDAARRCGWEVRFIEFMPLENDGSWSAGRVITGHEVRKKVASRWPIEPLPSADPRAPASRWRFLDGGGTIGFIDSVSAPFCHDCGRIRLTSDGKLRVCLYDDAETDLKGPLRAEASDEEILDIVRGALSRKGRGGALDFAQDRRRSAPVRTMHQIGG